MALRGICLVGIPLSDTFKYPMISMMAKPASGWKRWKFQWCYDTIVTHIVRDVTALVVGIWVGEVGNSESDSQRLSVRDLTRRFNLRDRSGILPIFPFLQQLRISFKKCMKYILHIFIYLRTKYEACGSIFEWDIRGDRTMGAVGCLAQG